MAAHPELALLTLAAVGLGGWAAYYFNEQRRWRRRLEQLPRSTIAGATDGVAYFVGTVHAVGALAPSPLSRTPSIAFHTRVVEGAGKKARSIFDHSHAVDFVLRDDTGEALVHVAKAALLFVAQHHYNSSVSAPHPDVQRFLDEIGRRSRGLFLHKTFDCDEAVLVPGDRVVVYGDARREIDPNPANATDYRATATRLVIARAPRGKLLVSNEPALLGVASQRQGEER